LRGHPLSAAGEAPPGRHGRDRVARVRERAATALLLAERDGPRGARRVLARLEPVPGRGRPPTHSGERTMTQPLVLAYVEELRRAARDLPSARRAELVQEIEEYLAEALPPDAGEAEVRTALDRLGDPEQIVAAERGRETGAP